MAIRECGGTIISSSEVGKGEREGGRGRTEEKTKATNGAR